VFDGNAYLPFAAGKSLISELQLQRAKEACNGSLWETYQGSRYEGTPDITYGASFAQERYALQKALKMCAKMSAMIAEGCQKVCIAEGSLSERPSPVGL
jgi:hypothetical protein